MQELTRDTHFPPYMAYPRFLLNMDLNETARLIYILLHRAKHHLEEAEARNQVKERKARTHTPQIQFLKLREMLFREAEDQLKSHFDSNFSHRRLPRPVVLDSGSCHSPYRRSLSRCTHSGQTVNCLPGKPQYYLV